MENKEFNSTMLISNFVTDDCASVLSKNLEEFKNFIKNELVDGIDFGIIPTVDKPCLFKSGGEKVQIYLGLSPRYILLNREFISGLKTKNSDWDENARKYIYTDVIRNYYAWEWACELWYGDVKVAEGVGMANTEEDKFVSQYKKGKTPDGFANTVMKIAKKRAFIDAIIAVSGISDMFTQDLEDDVTIQKLKTDKSTKISKLTKENIKEIYAVVGALNLRSADLENVLKGMGYERIQDCKAGSANTIISELKKLAKSRKGE